MTDITVVHSSPIAAPNKPIEKFFISAVFDIFTVLFYLHSFSICVLVFHKHKYTHAVCIFVKAQLHGLF